MEIMYFSAPWCGPCVEYRPLVEEVLTEYPDIRVRHVNIDDEMTLAYVHKVVEIPTLLVPGQPRLVGKATENDLRTWLNIVSGR